MGGGGGVGFIVSYTFFSSLFLLVELTWKSYINITLKFES